MKIGARIRQIRKKKGESQGDIAEKAGMRAAALCRVERGLVDPKVSTVEKIASALEVPLAWLFLEDVGSQTEREERAG